MDFVDVSLLTLLVCLLIYLVKWCRKQKGSRKEDETKLRELYTLIGSRKEDETKLRELYTLIDRTDFSKEDASQVIHRRRPQEYFTHNLASPAEPKEVRRIYAQEGKPILSVAEAYERQVAYPVAWLPPPPPDPPNPP